MSTKEKACRECSAIYTGSKCPNCGSEDSTEDWKGRVIILNTEKSEIAQKLKVKRKGHFAIKSR